MKKNENRKETSTSTINASISFIFHKRRAGRLDNPINIGDHLILQYTERQERTLGEKL
jgi:hypothetical protein